MPGVSYRGDRLQCNKAILLKGIKVTDRNRGSKNSKEIKDKNKRQERMEVIWLAGVDVAW